MKPSPTEAATPQSRCRFALAWADITPPAGIYHRMWGAAKHERATGVKKLVTIPNIKHYGIYSEARERAQKEALAWYDEHLKR